MESRLGDATQTAVAILGSALSSVDQAPETQRILDAATEVFVEFGIRRTTTSDIARRAGIDRVTVYRRLGSKDAVVQAVVTREATRLFDLVTARARQGPRIEERIELGFAAMMEQVRSNALLARMLQVEPDTVRAQLTSEGSTLLTGATLATLQFFEQAVEDGLLEGTEGLEPAAEILVRVVHSFMLTPTALISLESQEDLRGFARAHLVPMVLGSLS